jgi:hypothetical protein
MMSDFEKKWDDGKRRFQGQKPGTENTMSGVAGHPRISKPKNYGDQRSIRQQYPSALTRAGGGVKAGA